MKDFYIADAARWENQAVTSFFCLASINLRDGKGGQYLALTLADRTGQFEARMWEEFAEVLKSCTGGCYVKVLGQISKYQGKYQIKIQKIRSAAESEIDVADFVPASKFDIPSMMAELRGYVAEFRNHHLRSLVLSFLDDPSIGPAFAEAPAAKRLHHAWLGGLLEHVLSLVRVCRATAPYYPEVDPDLLVTGAILHDIGKVRELSWRSSFEYTLEGQLIGHISIAQGMLHEKIAELDRAAAAAQALQTQALQTQAQTVTPENSESVRSDSLQADAEALQTDANDPPRDTGPSEPFPQQLRLLVEHMLLTHHGKLEFGSPKVPMTPEALLLSALDDLEAKFQTLRSEFAAAASTGRKPGEVTEWVRSMERPLFNSRAYLDQSTDSQPDLESEAKIEPDGDS